MTCLQSARQRVAPVRQHLRWRRQRSESRNLTTCLHSLRSPCSRCCSHGAPTWYAGSPRSHCRCRKSRPYDNCVCCICLVFADFLFGCPEGTKRVIGETFFRTVVAAAERKSKPQDFFVRSRTLACCAVPAGRRLLAWCAHMVCRLASLAVLI